MNPKIINQEIPILVALAVAVIVIIFAYLKRGRLESWITSSGKFFSPEPRSDANVNWSLFRISFVALYVEIMLIRWVGTEVRVFAYFQNLALIACFLGFGLGCYWSGRHKSLVFSLLAIAGLTVLAEAPIHTWQVFLTVLSSRLSLSSDAAMWRFLYEAPFGSATWYLLFVASILAVAAFLLLLMAVMIPLGQWVGFYLDRASNPVQAYSANLLGSVAGIWIFAGMAFLRLQAAHWLALAIVLLALMPPFSRRLGLTSLIAAAGVFLLVQHSRNPDRTTYWSPYQKLEVQPLADGQYGILVNNTGYMTLANMTQKFLSQNPKIADRYSRESSYDAPFRFAHGSDRVLGNYFFPWQVLPYSARVVGILLSVAYSIPVFFAGIIFTESFSSHPEKSAAFGANIVGSVAGGLAQNVSFIFGMKMLLIFAAVFYASAGLCRRLEGAEAITATEHVRPKAA